MSKSEHAVKNITDELERNMKEAKQKAEFAKETQDKIRDVIKNRLVLSISTQGRELIGVWNTEGKALDEFLAEDPKYITLNLVCEKFKIGATKQGRLDYMIVKEEFEKSLVALDKVGDIRVVIEGSELYTAWLREATGIELMSKSGIVLPGEVGVSKRRIIK